jgi:hypothetical protein
MAPRYMIRDRDRIYGIVVTRRLRAMGIRDKPTAPASHVADHRHATRHPNCAIVPLLFRRACNNVITASALTP